MKVYSVTPNPALDLSGHVSAIVPNEKNHVVRPQVDPGGNGINASRVAQRLGAHTMLLGFLGGSTGKQVRELLEREGLRCAFTPIKGETRTNVTVTNDRDHAQTRLTFPGPTVSTRETRALESRVGSLRAPGIVLLGGSLPPGCGPRFYSRLAAAAAACGLGAILDVPAPDLARALQALPRPVRLLALKPNLAELEELAGIKLHSLNAIARQAGLLREKAALVCVSMGARGALFCVGGRVWFAQAPRIKAKGTVGAGDSLVGALAARLCMAGLTTPELLEAGADKPLLEAFAWGVAAGAATAAEEGTRLADPALVRRLKRRVRIRRVSGQGVRKRGLGR